MTSMMCVKTLDGAVKVHNRDSATQMMTRDEESNKYISYMKKKPKKKPPQRRPRTTPGASFTHSGPSMDAGSLVSNTMKMQDWISKRQVKDAQTLEKEREEEKRSRERNLVHHHNTQRLYQPLLEEEKSYVKVYLGDLIEETDMLQLRKKELLHKNWSDRVYEPIRRKIIETMNGPDSAENTRRRQELYHQFLEHVNRKGHVFLNTSDNAEYYARAINSPRHAQLSIYTPHLRDPLLQQGCERNKEDQTILQCVTGEVYTHKDIDHVRLPPLPLAPLGRHETDSNTWLEMPLLNIESTPRKASRQSKRQTYRKLESGLSCLLSHRSRCRCPNSVLCRSPNDVKNPDKIQDKIPDNPDRNPDNSSGGRDSSSTSSWSSHCPSYWSPGSWHDARLRMNQHRTKTQIDFNEWSAQPFDPQIVDHEMQLQHKRMFDEKPPYGIPPRQFAKAAFANQTTSAEHGAGFVPVST